MTVGTAGHVDHGKSTLVEALTSIFPDRLAEERERGLTIDLGFAWFTLPGGREVSVIDVPGHERFVSNMLAGVGGIDAVLLVIAADEGVMPQTREHLDIIDLLEIDAGVVALTKADLVDDEWAELVEEDVREALEGRTLADAPIVHVSAQSRTGLDELVETLDDVLAQRPPRLDRGGARIPIDRVFTMPGFGTVITGTLSGGTAARRRPAPPLSRGTQRSGPWLAVAPDDHRHRAARPSGGGEPGRNEPLADASRRRAGRGRRGVRNAPHRRPAAHAPGGGAGAEARRGRVAAHRGGLTNCAAPSAGARSHSTGRIRLGPVALDAPIAARRGDRYVIRRLSPAATIGGGDVVRALARHAPRGDTAVLDALERAAAGDAATLVRDALADRLVTLAELARRTELDSETTAQTVTDLTAGGEARTLRSYVGSVQVIENLTSELLSALRTHHESDPGAAGLRTSDLARTMDAPADAVGELAAEAAARGAVRLDGPRVALAGHSVELTEAEQRAAGRLLAQLDQGGSTPPSLALALTAAGGTPRLASALAQDGRLVLLAADIALSRRTYEAWLGAVRELFESAPSVTVREVRDALGTSRKYALALLEYLDSRAITRRVGDARLWLGEDSERD